MLPAVLHSSAVFFSYIQVYAFCFAKICLEPNGLPLVHRLML